jgi:hypothetical protein
MKQENRCETAARAYEERKRMRKLAGITEQNDGIDSEFKAKVQKLADGINMLTDELRKRKTK